MIREYVRLALKTLRTYRLRSTLTVVAITIAVTAIILLVSLAQSGLATLARGIEEVGGTRFIMLWEDSAKKAARKLGNYQRGLRYDDAMALKERIPSIERISGMVVLSRGWDSGFTVRRPGKPPRPSDMLAADEQFLPSFALSVVKGRNITRDDVAARQQVCIVAKDLADKLYPGEEAVGQEIVIGNDRYRIVGRLDLVRKGGMNFGWDWNDVVVVPFSVPRPDGRISMVAMTSNNPGRNQDLIDRANAILLERHNGVDDFQFLDFGGMLKGFYATFYAMILVVGLIAGMSLVIGGVGIMNIMLVAVAERRREIGLRKAVGASADAVMAQFLVESVVLALFGALIGSAVGLGLAELASAVGPRINRDWVGVVSYPAVFLAVVASAGTGLFFGWYPAREAARLDPILCLRSD
ncbi:MAG: ABC transporter permease [Candidatus Sericytochromatia bacterium]|uniref:ABC transporter permease n=1 Tax=Candidatus Tanganyikabacteria bacterium TaxID=2961651 RepID=A0A937X826_9BACT|nr:ABC transporter permease [Candidatus Tanganyikabacteria bacterium]